MNHFAVRLDMDGPEDGPGYEPLELHGVLNTGCASKTVTLRAWAEETLRKLYRASLQPEPIDNRTKYGGRVFQAVGFTTQASITLHFQTVNGKHCAVVEATVYVPGGLPDDTLRQLAVKWGQHLHVNTTDSFDAKVTRRLLGED